jgi:hypothetical protein
MNILQLSLLLAILLKCVTASESGVAQDVIQALKPPNLLFNRNFSRVKRLVNWENRKDLFDHVATKDANFIYKFINQLGWQASAPTLATLFIKGSEIADQVLKKIEYRESTLICLTKYRYEIAQSPDIFFEVIRRINDPKDQEEAVAEGVYNLFKAKEYQSVISLIYELESSTFDESLKSAAVKKAFDEGTTTLWCTRDIAKELYNHSAITSKEYAKGLFWAWRMNHIDNRDFLLNHADQGDLEAVEKLEDLWFYDQNKRIIKIFREAWKTAPAEGTRLESLLNIERAELVKEAFAETPSIKLDQVKGGPEDIILGYLEYPKFGYKYCLGREKRARLVKKAFSEIPSANLGQTKQRGPEDIILDYLG